MRLPDFFVVGAQKAGTTALCSILAAHPEVYFCNPKEPMFFCRDDPRLHTSLMVEYPTMWRAFDWNGRRAQLLEEYAAHYAAAASQQRLGEGSTSYLLSPRVAPRLKAVCPEARIVIMLREPVSRAWSAYWHMVRRGRVAHRFETQLRIEPGVLLESGFYREQIERYLAVFPREQVCFLAFEEFIRSPQRCVDRVCRFLGLKQTIDVGSVPQDKNEGAAPVSPALALGINGVARALGIPMVTEQLRDPKLRYGARNIADKLARRVRGMNLRAHRYPAMTPATRALLREAYARENRGLGALVGIDFEPWWGYDPDMA